MKRHSADSTNRSLAAFEKLQHIRASAAIERAAIVAAPFVPSERRVLPSSSVGEESLSPNHPDTSSRF